MKRFLLAISVLAMVAALTPPAAAARHAKTKSHPHHAAHLRYGPAPLGVWRPGPKRGYGFAFSTYRGDPFAKDDYWDGRECFYLHHRDFCRPYRAYEAWP